MTPQSSNGGGLLDLTEIEQAPLKIRLPVRWPRGLDWLRRMLRRPAVRLYDMANPQGLGALSLQRLLARYKRAEVLAGQDDVDDADLAEMMDLLVDVCQVVVPGAPRTALVRLGLHRQQRLIEAFFAASPAANRRARRAEAAKKASRS